MTTTPTDLDATASAGGPTGLRARIKLLRPKQWSKSVFVLLGPIYGFADLRAQGMSTTDIVLASLAAVVAFSLASSGCYVVNDLVDRERDRAHPRKRLRPIASGAVSVAEARVLATVTLLISALALLLLPAPVRPWVGLSLGLYIANVMLYSFAFKRVVMLDVISLAGGFVLRVVGGCAALGIAPTTWLLNVSFFLAMFLAFGKRLGERRTLGESAAQARRVQTMYSDDILRMVMVATAVVTLVTYGSYIQGRHAEFDPGFNLLWLTVLPATYGLFRALLLVERGTYDDPTELAVKDWPFQIGLGVFGVLSGVALWASHAPA